MVKVPKLQLHKPTGQGRVWINGKDHYLGKFGSPECEARYAELVAEYITSPERLPRLGERLTVHQLAVCYLEHRAAERGKKNARVIALRVVLGQLTKKGTPWRSVPACRFTPGMLGAFSDHLAAMRNGDAPLYAVSTVNDRVAMVRQMFRWAAQKDLVPSGVWSGLLASAPQRRGRSKARDPRRVEPVDDATIEATIALIEGTVPDMVRFQRLTGCRPGEVCALRLCDVDVSDDVWVWRLTQHKTAHRGKPWSVAIGPRARALIEKHATSDLTAPVFRTRTGKSYVRSSYRSLIRKACLRGGIPQWSPNQLRHTRATELRKLYGIEVASANLNHSNIKTTEVYAERNLAAQIKAARETG